MSLAVRLERRGRDPIGSQSAGGFAKSVGQDLPQGEMGDDLVIWPIVCDEFD